MSDTLPLARLWDWLLGLLPSESPEAEPIGSGQPDEEEEGDLGPEMDPNGNPAGPPP